MVYKYNEIEFSKSLIHKDEVIHSYGYRGDFLECIKWAQTEGYVIQKDYEAEYPES